MQVGRIGGLTAPGIARAYLAMIAWAGLAGGCAATGGTVAPTLEQLQSLDRRPVTYEDVVRQFGKPYAVWQTEDRKYAGYRIDRYGSALSGIDGKGFVPGIGGFVDTFKIDERPVTLIFERQTGRYLGFRQATPDRMPEERQPP